MNTDELRSIECDSQSQRKIAVLKNLSKSYGKFQAIKNINIEIYQGEIFGLIGPDGAGKTTTFHILAGIMSASSGQVFVLDKTPFNARLEIGYLTQIFSLYQDLSISENLDYVARLKEVPNGLYQERRERYLRLLGLKNFEDRLAGNLSGGMKQKLALCCALIARPRLLLLDEPTTGVDPVSRRDFWDLLAGIASEGVSIGVATPYLDEAERCSRIALIHKGEIYQTGSPAELRNSLGLQRMEIRLDDQSKNSNVSENNLDELYEVLDSQVRSNENNYVDVQLFGDRIDILVSDFEQAKSELGETLATTPLLIQKEEVTLENVFVSKLKNMQNVVHNEFPFQIKNSLKGAAIQAQSISKSFGKFQAVKNVDLQIDYGEIYGLLGANGAGKTTIIKMLCGLLDSSSGKINLAGYEKQLRSVELRRQIGYMSQKFVLYDDLTVMENLLFYCGTYDLSSKRKKECIDWTVNTFELVDYVNTIVGALPGGWKQKLSFASSVLHQPSIIFLDEPTSGVDPLARRHLWKYIRQFALHKSAILVTTHFLEEAEYCNRLGFIVDGCLVAEGSPSQIKSEQKGDLYAIKLSNNQRAYEILREIMDPWRVSIFGANLHLVVLGGSSELDSLLASLIKENLQILYLRKMFFSLEDSFINIVNKR